MIKNILKRVLTVFKTEKHTVANIVSLSPNQLLLGRTALVTGGTSGIGLAIAKAFLNSGATVIITGRNAEKIKNSVNELKTISNNIYGTVLDNTDISSFNKKIEDIITLIDGKKLDILVNNAGVNSPHNIYNANEEDFDRIIDTNLKGVFFLSQTIGRYMKENNIKGNILNIASASSLRPAAAPYAVSKWGLRGLTLGLSKAFIPYGIVVNGLAPGPTVTPMIKSNSTYIEHSCLPIGRYIMPEEIANMAVILTSSISKSIIGDIVYMTGGAGLITLEGDNYNF